jgi:hypothetical protein
MTENGSSCHTSRQKHTKEHTSTMKIATIVFSFRTVCDEVCKFKEECYNLLRQNDTNLWSNLALCRHEQYHCSETTIYIYIYIGHYEQEHT